MFSQFLRLSHPDLARDNAGERFFNFLNFFNIVFAIFLGIFFPGPSMSGISELKFFLSFSAYHIPDLSRNNDARRSFNSLNFFATVFRIFLGIFLPGPSMSGISD